MLIIKVTDHSVLLRSLADYNVVRKQVYGVNMIRKDNRPRQMCWGRKRLKNEEIPLFNGTDN